MQRISITNPQNIIDGTAKKYYFKLRNTGGPKGDKGDKGDTGATGPQGPQGNAATVSVGSTTTLPVGYDATVTNSGSLYNAVLNFGIPQGPQGPQGATGAKGDKGDKGDQGNTGPTGPAGQNATVYIGTTTTLNPGSQATVYNSGTENNAVLNFGIPRGDVGPQPELVQTTGSSTTKAMSQNATTVALNGKQNTLTAGSNIQISSNTISATDTTYTAGNGLKLNGTEFSADTDVLATKEDLEGYYTKPEADNLLAPKLETELVAELPTTGEEGKLYLTPKAHTTQTAAGNPITASVTEQAGAIESFQLDGDTYQQNYEGKNLIEPKMASAEFNGVTCTNNGDGSFTLNGTATSTATFRLDQSTYQAHDNLKSYSGEYTLSCNELTNGMDLVVMQQTTWTLYMRMRNSNAPVTATLNATDAFIYVGVVTGATVNNLTIRPMFEKGSTATSFEPYVGGVPSPNPDYPQPIQTVTGLQTITINGTDYPLDLGNIELCGLGDDGNGNPLYKDRIYRDGDDWKVHKKCKTITLDGSESWQYSGNYNFFYAGNISGMATPVDARVACYCRTHKGLTSSSSGPDFATEASNYPYAVDVHTTQSLARIKDTRFSSIQAIKAWLAQNNTTIYYVVRSATNTTITDTALIAQLEAIRTASLENGTNTITNTATGSNLAGDMEIGYYGYNPRNRYDKWLWLDINNEYEQIGS